MNLRLRCAETGEVIVERLDVADGIWTRFWGLQFRRELPSGAGLLLVPCSSVHTFFLRFAIDVLLLDRRGVVVALHRSVRPWRVVLPARGAYATLEVPAGSANIAVGATLRLDAAEGPRSLSFLRPSEAS